jgi:hypothetical protein
MQQLKSLHTSRQPPAVSPLPRGPTRAGTPVGPGMPATKPPSPLTDQAFLCPRLAFHLHEVTKDAPARRRCRMIAGAASGTAVLRLPVPPAACEPPPGNPETGTLLIPSSGPFAHRLPPPWRPPTPRQRPVQGGGITRPRAST